MNREDIIRMAIEAELNLYVNDLTEKQYIEVIERFATLVASAEREACAQLCETIGNTQANMNAAWRNGCRDAANEIRVRGQA